MVESQLNTHLHDINTLDCGPKVCVGLFKKYIWIFAIPVGVSVNKAGQFN